ncbi:hypothetical protein ACWEKM_37830 [Streptomyces sp. NPDC004752]
MNCGLSVAWPAVRTNASGRRLGIANLMVIHRLSDLLSAGDVGSRGRVLAEGLLADCSTLG